MDGLTWFGLIAVSAMLVAYALEDRSRWWILVFAASCVAGSAYGFLQGAWPFGVVEAIWSLVALRRWWLAAGSAGATRWIVGLTWPVALHKCPASHRGPFV